MKKKFFYGWIVIFATSVSMGLYSALTMTLFGVFVGPMTVALGVSTTAFLTCSSLRSLANTVTAPVAGSVADKKGIPFAVGICGTCITVGYVLMGLSTNLIIFYIAYLLFGVAGGFGGPMVNSAVAAKWFNKKKGLASGLAQAGGGVFGALLSPLVTNMMSTIGYSTTFFILAAVSAIGVFGVGVLFIKDNPAQMGLYPDGEEPAEEMQTGKPAARPEVTGVSLGEAMKGLNFWLLALGLFLFGIVSMAVMNTYNVAFQAVGFSPMVAATAVSVVSVVSIFTKILTGAMTDKFSPRVSAIIIHGVFAANCALMLFVREGSSVIMVYLFAALFAFGNSGWIPILIKYIMSLYGRKHFSSINGVMLMVTNFGSFVGPLLVGALFDMSGNYQMPYLVMMVITVLSIASLLVIKLPHKK